MARERKRPQKKRKSRWWALVKALIRSRIRTGLVVVVPVAFTIWVLQLVFKWLDGLLQPLAQLAIPLFHQAVIKTPSVEGRPIVPSELPAQVRGLLDADNTEALRQLLSGLSDAQIRRLLNDVPAPELLLAIWAMVPKEIPGAEWVIPGAGLVALFLLLYLVGFVTSATVGRRFVDLFDKFLEKVPISRTIYTASKQIVKTLGAEDQSKFKRVVLIPYPAEPLLALAFVTNTFFDEECKRDMTCVFLPTTPNPTSGFYLVIPSEKVRDVDMDVEQGVGQIMSGGIMLPEHQWTRRPANRPAGRIKPESP